MVEADSAIAGALPDELRVLLAHWNARAALAPRGVPHPDAVLPHIRDVWLNHLAIFEPCARSGYIVTRCGFALIRRFGRMATGHRVDALAGGIRQELSARLLRARLARRAAAGEGAIAFGLAVMRFAEIVLPLSDDGVQVSRLALFAREVSWRWPGAPDGVPDWERD